MIDRGATTIWETWKESDNVYSNCHPMFGSVSEWFYRWLGGIQPDPENPGFRKFIISLSAIGPDLCKLHLPVTVRNNQIKLGKNEKWSKI